MRLECLCQHALADCVSRPLGFDSSLAEFARRIPGIADAAQKSFWAHRQLSRRVKCSSELALYRFGQLTPAVRSVCCTALSACGVSGGIVGHTATATALLAEALGKAELASLNLIQVSCNSKLLWSAVKVVRESAMLPDRTQQLPCLTTAAKAQSVAGTSVPRALESLQATVAETTTLVMLLGTPALQPEPQHGTHVWMAVAAKLAALQEGNHAAASQNGVPLGPAVVKSIARKALGDVQTWAQAMARQCQSSIACGHGGIVGLRWERRLPPLGPVQVLHFACTGMPRKR